MDPVEFARLQAVEKALKAALARPGHITRDALLAALASQPEQPALDPFTSSFEETF